MSTKYPDLLPDFSEQEEATSSPVRLLRAQAELLEQKTSGLVRASVQTARSASDRVAYELALEAPLVSYRYKVLRIEFGMDQWPVDVSTPGNTPQRCQDEDTYHAALRSIFDSAGFRRAVQGIRELVREEVELSDSEREILNVFRVFTVGANEYLPTNSLVLAIQKFPPLVKDDAETALGNLLQRGLLTETADSLGYILTPRGADVLYKYSPVT